MNLNDLKISTQLRLGLGLLVLLVVILGAVAWRQGEALWLQTATIYEHPLPVRRALSDLKVDILSMRLESQNEILATNEEQKRAALQNNDIHKADVARQIGILRKLFLGPAASIDDFQNDFIRWDSSQQEIHALVRDGKVSVAMDRTRDAGDIGNLSKEMMLHLEKIDAFARNKAEQLYENATEEHRSSSIQLAALLAGILFLSVLIGWVLLQTISSPLRHLAATAAQLRQGKMDARSRLISANEFGALSASFNTMADAIQKEMMIEKNAAEISHIMLRQDEVHAFCLEMLRALLLHTGSQVGAVYFLNEAGTAYEHIESIGLGTSARASFSASEREGELGGVLAARRIQRITNIPADSRFTFAAVSGEFHPKEILTIPVLSDQTVTAVISLASVRAYDEPSVRLINDIWSVLTARVTGVLAFQKIQNLAVRLERQNHELDSRKEEMSIQTDELIRQNSELEMQKRELDEASRLKSDFLSNMSHELRTPLNSVIALSGVLSRRLAKTIPEEESGYLEIIERNGKALLALINDLLDLSRIEAGGEDINVSRFSVHHLVGEIADTVAPQAQKKKVALINSVFGDLPLIASDPDKCRHILQNLIGNAVKFTEQGQVEITADIEKQNTDPRSPHSAFRISVVDTGIGIAADHLPHIFDEFRQADSSTSRKYGGTGLGLAIAKKYADLLGGIITVESAPGHGSTFTLRLPLSIPEGERAYRPREDARSQRRAMPHTNVPPVAAAGHANEAGRQPAKHILLVEDNEPAIIQMTHLLESGGYRVQVARNGIEGLMQIAQTVLPDAIILDLMMPIVDGFQMLKAIRSAERTAHLPVLILTAKNMTKEELSCLKDNNVLQLIQKGDINKAELLAAVARMLAHPTAPEAAKPGSPGDAAPTVVHRKDAATSGLASPHRRRPAHPGKSVVLLVEDNPDHLRAMKALLGDRYAIIEAADGRAAVEQAQAHRPDLILTDIALPDRDGIQALRELRQDASLRDTPVIAVTASAMKGDREQILAHGFDGYISKPLDHDALLTLLAEFLEEPQS